MLALSAALAAPALSTQWERQSRMLAALDSKSLAERAALLDNPAFAVAHAIAEKVPPDACVQTLAYAGPAAVDYYNARFDYLLYPRKVSVTADVSAPADGCGYLAVFRDTPQNLAAEPFAENWDEAVLAARTEGAERLGGDSVVSVFKLR